MKCQARWSTSWNRLSGGISIIRYADGTTLTAESKEELNSLVMKVKSQSEVAQSCPTLSNPMDCSLPSSSAHGIPQARVLPIGIQISDYGLLIFRCTIFKILMLFNMWCIRFFFVFVCLFVCFCPKLTVWITTNWKILKREYQNTLPASWKTCMQVKKQVRTRRGTMD